MDINYLARLLAKAAGVLYQHLQKERTINFKVERHKKQRVDEVTGFLVSHDDDKDALNDTTDLSYA
eukprot:5243081-Karenia_brevis.AAC.1